jgi:triosephosphate isomerase
MRVPLMAGNWKMYKSVGEAIALVQALKESLADIADREILVCPPFTALYPVAETLKGSNIELGAQNIYPKEEGAYTGEISPTMLVDVGCRYVIVGHSERRQHFKESDEFINRKVHLALEHGLRPILCVGETLEEREAGHELKVVTKQVQECLAGGTGEGMKEVVIAYEPVWAIGTGRTATPEQAQTMHKTIRDILKGLYGRETAEATRIIYGGSVKPDNVDDLMREPDIDGTLVGGASLKAETFARIVRFK